MTAVVATLGAVLLVVVAGLPIGYVLLRDVRLGLLVAPIVTGLTAAVAVILMLVAGGSLRWWLGGLLIAQWAATPVLLRTVAPVRAPHASWADLLWLTVPLIPPFLTAFLPPTEWDAHSIWWLHAAYFTRGATMARQYIGHPSINISHPDYPPLLSATVAGAWSVFRGYGLYVAQFVSATLSFSAIAMLGYAVRVVTGRAPVIVSRLAAVCVALAAWGAAPFAAAKGYADPLWSAAFVAAALLLLFRPDPLRRPGLAVLLLTAVALTKNEGFVMAAVLAAIATVRMRHVLGRAWVVWLPVGGGLVWSAVARHLGAKSDIAAEVDFGSLLRGSSQIYDRLSPTLSAIWATVGAIVAVSMATAVIGGITLRRPRRALGLGGDLWLWSVALAYLAILSATYLVSTNEIHWYLNTSVARVTLPFALMAAASAVCWGVAAVTGGRIRGRATSAAAIETTSATPSPAPTSGTAEIGAREG
ncbi:MAG TPA: hypothetical protein VGJ07_04460 [Rugosimonospora sp.]